MVGVRVPAAEAADLEATVAKVAIEEESVILDG